MTLEQFIRESGMSRSELAEKIGVTEVTIHRYLKKGAIPDRDVMPRLVKATGGKVQPNDFYRLPKKYHTKAG